MATIRKEFSLGAIVRIKCENFLTYDSVELIPGPQLNLIIGPNGTGKSTLVCLICLGLGGKPNIIGRAGQISDYIKHGNNKAMTEIELYNNKGENWIVNREIFPDNTSTWMLNKQSSSQKAIERLTNELNIQIGNLCQFLPQDRVCEFARMSQQDLLINTEKAVGTLEMLEYHLQLKKLRTEVRDLENSKESGTSHLEKERQTLIHIEKERENFEERQRHLEEVAVLKQKRAWVEYNEVRRVFCAKKQEKNKLSDKLKALKNSNQPLEKKLQELRNSFSKLEEEMKEIGLKIRNQGVSVTNVTRVIQSYKDKITECNNELAAKQQDEMQRLARLHTMKQQLEGMKNELASIMQNSRDIEPLLKEVNINQQKVSQELLRVQNEKDNCRSSIQKKDGEIKTLQRDLQRNQDVAQIKFNILRQRHNAAYEASVWLRKNKNQFKKPVYDPIMTQINVIDQQNAKYVEMHIPFNDLAAFVFEDKDDLKVFMDIVRDNLKYKISAVLAPSVPLENFVPSKPIEYYRKWGFHSYLKDLFTAPNAIMRYLCTMYKIHEIPVGNKYTQDNIEQVLNDVKFRRFYTDYYMYSIKYSRYDPNVKSVLSTEVRKPTLLTVSTDMALHQELTSKLQMKQQQIEQDNIVFNKLHQEEQQLYVEQDKLRKEKKELIVERDKTKTLMMKISEKTERIQHSERDAINIEEETAKATSQILTINKKRCAALQDLNSHSKQRIKLAMNKIRVSLHYSQTLADKLKAERELHEASQNLQSLEEELEVTKRAVMEIRNSAEHLLKKAREITGVDGNGELPEKCKEQFNRLPKTLDEIDNQIHEKQAKADCIFEKDKSVVHQYRQKRNYINQLEKDLTEKQYKLDQLKDKIEEIKKCWLPHLEDLINRINNNFSRFMSMMHCAGEISLNKSENQDDFEKYGICIKVKYRDSEQLKELTPYQQSGGERSVATVLYMISLQELTKVPFRCVDEINQVGTVWFCDEIILICQKLKKNHLLIQGMDSTNERKVFELVVKTACQENSSQYFLLTPKLLPDLEFSENMTVLLIHNGPKLISHTKWNLQKFIRRRHRLAI
ncbi:structural maintenance of chromosomes protein 5-like isoform X1 [Centruroides sculpturatus]|uniref:structural maintenance of chromosomes protein 5-like isoform X1 n=1 Tax=Centruroides sculpturatus TaxID=218467 RepID=UPI000C6D416C|nr:structural maintenance of chromosomes protein 5-like isoform X1 [Centruroides sculpturatus]